MYKFTPKVANVLNGPITNLRTHVNGESPYLHVTACELLNDVIILTDLRKNTENCFNNWKSIASNAIFQQRPH